MRPLVAKCGSAHFAYLLAPTKERGAAIAYSIVSTCHLLGINPTEYLADIFPRLARRLVIARDLPELTPSACGEGCASAVGGQTAAPPESAWPV